MSHLCAILQLTQLLHAFHSPLSTPTSSCDAGALHAAQFPPNPLRTGVLATLHARALLLQDLLMLGLLKMQSVSPLQAPAAPAEGQRAGLATRPRSHAALSGVESSGLVTLTESADDAAGADDAEMEEEVVGDPQPYDAPLHRSPFWWWSQPVRHVHDMHQRLDGRFHPD